MGMCLMEMVPLEKKYLITALHPVRHVFTKFKAPDYAGPGVEEFKTLSSPMTPSQKNAMRGHVFGVL